MNVTVEHISPIQRKITVEVPAEVVSTTLARHYKKVSKTAKVRGFRPGKAPQGLIRRLYRADIEERASEELVRSNLIEALGEASTEPLAVPEIETEPLAEGEAFVFSLFCQVKPTIELQGLEKLTAQAGKSEPDEEDIVARLEEFRERHAEREPVEDRGADIGDIVTIDYAGRLAGEEEPFEGGTASDHEIELGSGRLVPGFEDQLMGTKEGDERTVELTFPEQYVEHLAGKDAVFTVTVKSVGRKVLPDLDDDFAQDVEFEDMSALRASIYDELASSMLEEEEGRLREEVLNQLLAENPLEVPSALLQEAAQRLTRQLAMHLTMSGMSREAVGEAMTNQRETIMVRARELAHRDLLLDALAAVESIEVSPEELDAEITVLAERTGQPKPRVRAELQSDGRLEGLSTELQHRKTVAWLVDRALNPPPPVEEDSTEPVVEGQDTQAPADDATADGPPAAEEDSTEAAAEEQVRQAQTQSDDAPAAEPPAEE